MCNLVDNISIGLHAGCHDFLAATLCYSCPRLHFGFQFGLYHVVVALSVLRSISLAYFSCTVEHPVSVQKKRPLKRGVRLWEFKKVVFVCSWEHE